MQQSLLTIEGRQFGRGRTLFPAWQIPLGAASEEIPLRALIARIVREETAAFRERQAQRQTLQALTAQEIAAGAAAGKIDSGGHAGERELQTVDDDQAVAAALQAFEDGVYYVFVDDQQVERLDDTVSLRDGSRMTFLRLVALAGG